MGKKSSRGVETSCRKPSFTPEEEKFNAGIRLVTRCQYFGEGSRVARQRGPGLSGLGTSAYGRYGRTRRRPLARTGSAAPGRQDFFLM